MKKIIGTFAIIFFSLQNTFAEDYYFGTKFCREFEVGNIHHGEITYSLDSKNYAWIKDGTIFINGQKKYENIKNIYEIWGFVDNSKTLVFSTRNDDKSETLYEGNKKIGTFDNIDRSFEYNPKTNSWSILVGMSVRNKEKYYQVKDGVLSTEEYDFYQKRELRYSRNEKFSGKVIKSGDKYFFEYNGKKTKLYNEIYGVSISNNGKKYSFSGKNTDGKNIQIIDGVEKIGTNKDIVLGYSDNSKDIFYTKHNNLTGENFLYKNGEKIGKTNRHGGWNYGREFDVLVENGEEKYWIVNGVVFKNFKNMLLPSYSKNGDMVISGEKQNGNSEFIINEKTILNSKSFISWPLISQNGNDYFAIIDNNGHKKIYENGFYSPEFYYYYLQEGIFFQHSNDLQLYNFSPENKDVFCRDITYMYPELKAKKEAIKKLLHKLQKLKKNEKKELILGLEKYLKNTEKNTKKYDLLNMLIFNLK